MAGPVQRRRQVVLPAGRSIARPRSRIRLGRIACIVPLGDLTHIRVQEAKGLFRSSTLRLADIALICGFGDQSYFTRVFTRSVGASPGAWRRPMLRSLRPGSANDRSCCGSRSGHDLFGEAGRTHANRTGKENLP
jgi:AraC-like DNA-binding protein